MLKEKKTYRSILPINRLFKSYLEIEENLKVERGLGQRVFSKESFETAQEVCSRTLRRTSSLTVGGTHSLALTGPQQWKGLMSEEKQCGGHRLLGSAGRKH